MRVIALCKGGPLDGQTFSVEEGEPLASRQEIVGVLYAPTSELGSLPDEEIVDKDGHVEIVSGAEYHFPWSGHAKVVIYAVG